MGKRSLAFVRELGHRVMQCTGEVKARKYFYTASLRSSTERECCFSDGGPVRAGPVLRVTVCVSLFAMCEGFVDVEVVFCVPLQVACIILFCLYYFYFIFPFSFL